jgi:sugar transferase (PEP-CTERM/EpsH1 system associated)
MNAGSHWLAGKSLTEGLFWSKPLASTLDYWADVIAFDYVFVYCSSMLPYAERETLRDIPRVVDLVDVDSQKWMDYATKSRFIRRRIYQAEAKRISRLEKACVAQSKAVLLASEAEAALLRKQQGTKNPSILGISNGVDFSYFDNRSSTIQSSSPASPVGRESARLRLVFVGVLDYLPNVDGLGWFLNEVWPGVRQKLPAATLEIVGKNPTSQVQQFHRHPGVRVIGAVDDVRPWLTTADVVIAPLRIARGIQNKVLEAMAMEKTVLVTSPAAEGIDAIPDKHWVIADSAEAWQENLVSLAKCPEACTQMGKAAREFVEHEFDWSTCLEPLDKLLDLPVAVPERQGLIRA